MSNINVRSATRADMPLILGLVAELAEYEKLSDQITADPQEFANHLFGPRPYAEVLIGELDGHACGFALFFHNFSTFLGKPGIYLEDLYVRADTRGSGLGKALLGTLEKRPSPGAADVWNGLCLIGMSRQLVFINNSAPTHWKTGRSSV